MLEDFHSILLCYLWLSHKFENSFVEYELCSLLLERVYDLINIALESSDKKKHVIFEDEEQQFSARDYSKDTLYSSFLAAKESTKVKKNEVTVDATMHE